MLKNKSTVRFISVVLAIVLWAYVLGEVNPTVKKTFNDIPVELTNTETLADRGLALPGDEEFSASVIVKGSRSDLNELEISDIHVTADLYGYEKGDNHVSLDVVLPDGVSLEELKTPEITVTIEELESKSLPVTVEFTGTPEEHLEPAYASYVPGEVEVKGAASVVAQAETVRVQLDADQLSENWEVYTEAPSVWNRDGKLIKNVSISAHAVEVEAVMLHTKTVPLELKVTGTPDSQYGKADVTIPKEITVKGTSYALERVTSISAENVDISEVKKDGTVAVKPVLPSGIQLSDSSADIGVKIEFK